MKGTCYTEEQIVCALRQVETEPPVAEGQNRADSRLG